MTMSKTERLEKRKMQLDTRIEVLKQKASEADGDRKLYYLSKINEAFVETLRLQAEIEKEKNYYKR